jgi:uncharacterized protein (TIGR00369 family)
MKRTRQIHWENPEPAAKQALKMSGIDYLNAMGAGHLPLPPLLYTLDFKIGELEEGSVSFSFRPQEFHYNPIGTVHGGVISAILDSAMGCSLHTLLEIGKAYTTLELKVNFLKAVTIKTGELKAIGKVVYLGGRTALVEAQLVNEKGQLYAHATSTCMIFKF